MCVRKLLAAIALALATGFTICAAADEVVVIVSTDNPVVQLSNHEIADIYLGRRARFPDGRLARPIDQKETKPVRAAFYEEIVGRTSAQIRAHWSRVIFTGRGRPPPEASDDLDMLSRVTGDPNAIGYIERRNIDESVRIVNVD